MQDEYMYDWTDEVMGLNKDVKTSLQWYDEPNPPLFDTPVVEFTLTGPDGSVTLVLDKYGSETLGQVLAKRGPDAVRGKHVENERRASLQSLVNKIQSEGIKVTQHFIGEMGDVWGNIDQIFLETSDDIPRVVEICGEHDDSVYGLSIGTGPNPSGVTTENWMEDRFITFVGAESGKVRRVKQDGVVEQPSKAWVSDMYE